VVVVGRNYPAIHARIKAKVKTNWGLSLFGSPWPQTGPLVIQDTEAFGNHQVDLDQDFKTLSKEQLGAFVGLDRPFEVGLSKPSVRIPGLIESSCSIILVLRVMGNEA
jgi:hypothetical protein